MNLIKAFSAVIWLILPISCTKTKVIPVLVNKDTTVVISPAIEPKIDNTIGFFLDNWQPKAFIVPQFTESSVIDKALNTVTIDASDIITKIPNSIFGHNAVWWMGPVSNEPKFIEPITNLQPNILRFPAGSGSDCYFWNRKEGELPADTPKLLTDAAGKKQDPGYRQGMSDLNWQCNLNDYYSMLQKTNSKGIITVNYGYARYGTSADPVATAAHLAADWVRYDNGRTSYWEVGNENFGDWEWGYRIDTSLNKDNQPELLTGGLYAKHFQVFADSMKKAAKEIGKNIQIGAVTYDAPSESWQTICTKTWNSTMMSGINNKADFYVVHNYFTPYDQNSNATIVLNSAITVPQKMMNYIKSTLVENGATIKPIAMDEWNMWAKDNKQRVSNTSGLFAIIVQAEAIKNKYGLAARWDLLNGWDNGDDMGLFSSGEPGVDKWTMRPSFFHMYYFQKCIGDRLVSSEITLGNASTDSYIKAYGSTYSSGQMNVTLVNTSGSPETVEIKTKNYRIGSRFYWYSLEGSTDNGQFSRKVLVNGFGPKGIAGGPAEYATIKAKSAITTNGIRVSVPAWGSVCMIIDNK